MKVAADPAMDVRDHEQINVPEGYGLDRAKQKEPDDQKPDCHFVDKRKIQSPIVAELLE